VSDAPTAKQWSQLPAFDKGSERSSALSRLHRAANYEASTLYVLTAIRTAAHLLHCDAYKIVIETVTTIGNEAINLSLRKTSTIFLNTLPLGLMETVQHGPPPEPRHHQTCLKQTSSTALAGA
jgi:hypothetical protein